MGAGQAMDLFDLGQGLPSLRHGVQRIRCPALVIGVQSDILFPISQQRELAELLRCGLSGRSLCGLGG